MANGIMIIGACCSGKSTLAKALAAQFGYKHIEMDRYIWAGGVKRPPQEWQSAIMDEIAKGEDFVMDGQSSYFLDSFTKYFTAVIRKLFEETELPYLAYGRHKAS